MTNKELEERLIDFSALVIKLTESIKGTYTGNHLSAQLIRSGTSVSLNYGEAQDAESRKDFIHKMKVILKELRETIINLKLIMKIELISDNDSCQEIINENNELISIFVKSIQTARKNLND
jgi:four helix bundle protein